MSAGNVTAASKPQHHNGIFMALVPWVLFTFVAAHGTVKLASLLALAVAIGISLPSVIHGRPKSLELGAVVAFAGFAAVAFLADSGTADFMARYARGIAAALLALIAFGSLLFVPFTEQYAREQVPRQAWGSPTFKHVNRQLTLMWASVFAAMVPFHIVAGAIDTTRSNLIFNYAIPVALVLWAIKRTDAISSSAGR
jgi:hypothetical protein